ncbi:hypothetical protein [Prescottella sp. R16]|uniref:hypothetical protein n=1 Tax=Prescottella sp. R16 TaxID=3064529 RepID=UPI00272EB95E|nr:hypothetical protein [Prescottella sp. R16]
MPETLAIIQWDQAYNRNGNSKLPRAAMNALRTYMNNHTLTGWVSQETLAENTGLTVRGVRKQLDANEAAGWLEIVEQGRSARATVYRLAIPTGTTVPVEVATEEPTGTTVPVDTGSTGTTVPGLPEPQFRPTAPRTSPQEKFYMGTTPRRGNPGSAKAAPEIPHQGDQDETGQESRSLAVAGPENRPAKSRQAEHEPASAGAIEAPEEYRPVGLQPLSRSSIDDDPFADAPAWRAEAAAREKRAARRLEPATAPSPLDPFA